MTTKQIVGFGRQMNITTRSAEERDVDVLWQFLAMAAHENSATAAKCIPVVSAHLRGWKRGCDFGFITLRGSTPIGAVWARQFHPVENPALFVDHSTPELCIAVKGQYRGMGVGAQLLGRLHAEAISRGVDLCLNVNDDNPARRLYDRLGYEKIPGMEKPNRFGGVSIGMVLRLRR